MNKFFLLNEALEANTTEELIAGCNELMLIEKQDSDELYKHESIYLTKSYLNLCNYQGQDAHFLIQFFQREFQDIEKYLTSENELLNHFNPNPCAFLGINFSSTSIPQNRVVVNNATYRAFVQFLMTQIVPNNFWLWKEFMFYNLSFCKGVENQVIGLGNSGHFRQVVDQLSELNRYAAGWTSGSFNYQEVKRSTNLDISPESNGTMAKYGNQRRFSLPDGSKEFFTLHLKTGDLRFHIFPRDGERRIYVGYIGPHLDIISS